MFNRFSEYEGLFVKKKALCDLSYSYVTHAVHPHVLVNYHIRHFSLKNGPSLLSISKTKLETFIPKFPNQTLRQIGQGVHAL